jgi:hypothetical protein
MGAKRRQVVVARQVFDLGLKEFQESVTNGEWPTMELEVAGTVFQVGLVRPGNVLTLNWWAATNIRNIMWTRFLFLKLGWPPVKKVQCFTFATAAEKIW